MSRTTSAVRRWPLRSFRNLRDVAQALLPAGSRLISTRISAYSTLCGIVIALAFAMALHADLSQWVQNLATDTGLRGVFFRPMALPYGAVDGRRPPRETRPALTERIAASPKDAYLYRLRAGEDELALDFAAAEADWKTYATLANDGIALADYYHRRLQTSPELAALEAVATPAAFERAIKLAEDQGLPGRPLSSTNTAHGLPSSRRDGELAKALHPVPCRSRLSSPPPISEIQAYRRAFPDDEGIWVEEVGLTLKRGSVDQAIAIFDKAFRPLMPANWLKGYFDLLNGQGRLRDFLSNARAAAAAQPESLDPIARQFHYYQNEKNARCPPRSAGISRAEKELDSRQAL